MRGTNEISKVSKDDVGTVTFYSATNLYFFYDFDGSGKRGYYYYKDSDKLILDGKEVSKKNIASTINW